ncbi:MAG: aryl-sulfate sulfotransferase [Halobacteriales archaeon]
MRRPLPDQLSVRHLLAVAAVVLYLGWVAASAATAPPIDRGTTRSTADPPADGSVLASNATLVGMQGSFRAADGTVAVVREDGSIARETDRTPWANFDVEPLDGDRVLVSFLERDADDCGPYESPCARTGFRIYNLSTDDPLEREWTIPVRRHLNRESHDADVLPNGDVVVADMEQERIVVVNETGEVVWEWRAESFYEAPEDPTLTDWLHVNDVDAIGEDRFLVSVRNANQLLVIERGEGVVEVVNEDDGGDDESCRGDGQLVDADGDGDVRCGDPDVFDHQHNPQWLSPTEILVADSDNDRVVLVKKRDGDWAVTWSLDSAGGIPFRWPRDVDRLANGNLLITDSLNDRIVEVDWNGTVVWSSSPAGITIPYEADRLPGGEYGAGTRTGNGTAAPGSGVEPPGGVSTPSNDHVPVLTDLYRGAVGTIALPHWFSQWHFLGGALTLVVATGSLAGGRLSGD